MPQVIFPHKLWWVARGVEHDRELHMVARKDISKGILSWIKQRACPPLPYAAVRSCFCLLSRQVEHEEQEDILFSLSGNALFQGKHLRISNFVELGFSAIPLPVHFSTGGESRQVSYSRTFWRGAGIYG